MNPRPDFGKSSYGGSGKLAGKAALITGGVTGIGYAVALELPRKDADVLKDLEDESDDAAEPERLVEAAG